MGCQPRPSLDGEQGARGGAGRGPPSGERGLQSVGLQDSLCQDRSAQSQGLMAIWPGCKGGAVGPTLLTAQRVHAQLQPVCGLPEPRFPHLLAQQPRKGLNLCEAWAPRVENGGDRPAAPPSGLQSPFPQGPLPRRGPVLQGGVSSPQGPGLGTCSDMSSQWVPMPCTDSPHQHGEGPLHTRHRPHPADMALTKEIRTSWSDVSGGWGGGGGGWGEGGDNGRT